MPLLDPLLRADDAARVEHRIVSAPLAEVYDAAVTTDFLDAPREHAAVKALFAVHSSLERVAAALARRPFTSAPSPPSLTLEELPEIGEWVRLGEAPPLEVAFGAVVGRFWAGDTRWVEISCAGFRAFDQPGHVRIGCALAFASLPEGCTAVTFEVRAEATDVVSQRALRRFWRAVSPFAGVIMRATLSLIDERASAGIRGRTLEQAWTARGGGIRG
jgi:hypothetical protein